MSAKKKESLKDVTNVSPTSPSGNGNTRTRGRRNRKRVDKKESQAAFVAAELPGGGFLGWDKGSRGSGKDQLPGTAPHGGLQEGVRANLLLNLTNESPSGNTRRSGIGRTANLPQLNRPGLSISVTPPRPGDAPLPRTPLNNGARGRGAGGSKTGRGGGVKREREPQVANQSQVDIIDPNHVKNENDQENNEVEVTFESHPAAEAIEARKAVTKLTMLKQKKRKLEMEKMKLQEEMQDLDAKIYEAREQVAKF